MLELTVLSPHRDDAAFSLCIALSSWSSLPVALTVVNCFTISAYAPRASSTTPSTVSALRATEDRRALRSISQPVKIESLDLLDAPLRFGISPAAISNPETAALQTDSEIDSIACRIRRYFTPGPVLAPLALGDHVDHLAIRRAALANSKAAKLAFYEDLPYAAWTSDAALRERVAQTERAALVKLRPFIIRAHNGIAHKYRVVKRYRSQINSEEAANIAQYAAKYGAGERIWIPMYSSCWRPLLQ